MSESIEALRRSVSGRVIAAGDADFAAAARTPLVVADPAVVVHAAATAAGTRSRLAKVAALADLFGRLDPADLPTAIRRLEARPIATLSVEAQERHERRERVYRDD